jgi:hypothetical protein
MAMRGFKVTDMAEAVIKATDGDVIPFPEAPDTTALSGHIGSLSDPI